jgi:murein DD-endopeptidase MepM/ murein hydrolase activator NlpD
LKWRIPFLLYRSQTWQWITIIMAVLLLIGTIGVSGLRLSHGNRAMPTYQVAALVPTDRATTIAYHSLYFSPTYTPSSTRSANDKVVLAVVPSQESDTLALPTATNVPTAIITPEATATSSSPTATSLPPLAVTQPAQEVAVAEAPPYAWFVDAPIAASNPFSVGHNGVDVNVPVGTGVYAIASGFTYCAPNTNGCGQININHGNGLFSFYGHVDEQFVGCRQEVSQGQLIGRSGTLTCAGDRTHPHAHLSVMQNNNFIDPMTLYYD